MFLNAVGHATCIDVIDSLAHESAHSRRFGPMGGVYHATFVSARMHWAMSRLIASGLLTDEEMALAVKALDDDRSNLEKGTTLGRRVGG